MKRLEDAGFCIVKRMILLEEPPGRVHVVDYIRSGLVQDFAHKVGVLHALHPFVGFLDRDFFKAFSFRRCRLVLSVRKERKKQV